MTTTEITESSSTTSIRSTRGLIVAAIVLLAAIAVVVAVLLSGIFTSAANPNTGGSGADHSKCLRSTVMHYC